jgi:hypothetical protein
VEEDADGLARRAPGEGVVDGFLPELGAQRADGRVGDELGEADEFEVEGAEGGVGVLRWGGDEAADEVRVVVACSMFVSVEP